MKKIVILHENPEWVVPLRQAFERLGVSPEEWHLDQGQIPFDERPEAAIYYNRMSASSHTRGHRFAPELTRLALTWLEHNGITPVNGSRALAQEICKLSQYAGLQQAGVKTPLTRAVVGRDQILDAAEAFAQWPLILKPNRGGKGLGVQKFENTEGLAAFLASEDYADPIDGIWLLQEFIQSSDAMITRCEFVGGRFLYAVDVATDGGFELCPADVCAISDQFCPVGETPVNKFRITEALEGDPLIAKLEGFLAQSGIDIAGIEVIRDPQGQLYAYDVNTNTNYNAQAEQEAKIAISGMDAIARYLVTIAEQG